METFLLAVLLGTMPDTVAWQVGYEEALAQALDEDRPLLVCFNMDGEVANDFAADTIYRDPEFVELSRGFVCVVCSIGGHEQDEVEGPNGPQPVCRRFGTISCEQHQACERKARAALIGHDTVIAPQHFLLAPDGQVLERRAYHQPLAELSNLMRSVLDPGAAAADARRQAEETLAAAEKMEYLFQKQQILSAVPSRGAAREVLLEYLRKGKDDPTRASVAQALAASGDFTVLAPLCEAASDRSPLVGLAAVDALGELRLPLALATLKKCLGRYPKGQDHGRVLIAYAACGATDEAVRKGVLGEARSGDADRRAYAIVALAQFEPDEEVLKILTKAFKDTGLRPRAAAVWTAGMAGAKGCRADLERLQQTESHAELREMLHHALQVLDQERSLEETSPPSAEDQAGQITRASLRWRIESFVPLHSGRF